MTRAWYFAALVPLVIGGVIAALAFSRLFAGIESMPRMVAPGAQTFTLPAGEYVVYAESESTVDGVAYVNDKFRVSCTLSSGDGSPIELTQHGGRLKYALGGYEGGAIFDFTLASDGPVRLTCETDDGKAVLAVGKSFGLTIVAGVLPLVFGVIGAAFTLVVVRKRRKRYLALVAARDNT